MVVLSHCLHVEGTLTSEDGRVAIMRSAAPAAITTSDPDYGYSSLHHYNHQTA